MKIIITESQLKTLINSNKLSSTIMESSDIKTNYFIEKIKNWENNKEYSKGGWDEKRKKWFPHSSIEGGSDTIAYGHKIKGNEDFTPSLGITDAKAEDVLSDDIDREISKIKTDLGITNFDKLPTYVKQAIVNASYRGELKSPHKTVDHIRNNRWDEVAGEYLDNDEYRYGSPGVKPRMEWNAEQFEKYANSLNPKTEVIVGKPIVEVTGDDKITIYYKTNSEVKKIKVILLDHFANWIKDEEMESDSYPSLLDPGEHKFIFDLPPNTKGGIYYVAFEVNGQRDVLHTGKFIYKK